MRHDGGPSSRRRQRRAVSPGIPPSRCGCAPKSSARLNLFSFTEHALGDDDIKVVQAMADVATIGILHERLIRDADAFSTQLEVALESRVVIEQAKGIIAEHSKISVDVAFDRMRSFARGHNRLLSDTARQVIDGSLETEDLSPAGSATAGSVDDE